MNNLIRVIAFPVVVLLLNACSDNVRLDKELRLIIEQKQLDAEFEPDHKSTNKALADLGADLFFSPDLSIDGSVSCASCHHPDKAGADGIQLPIGIGGGRSENVGEDRIKFVQKENPNLSLQGLIPRNSPTVFNAALYRENLFWDGRVKYVADPNDPNKRHIISGLGPMQYNPSNYLQSNLLQTQARMPMTSTFEMKGGLKPNKNNHEIEQDVLRFLQSSEVWCEKFSAVYGVKNCDDLITLNHLTEALAEFQSSLIFTDSPFERYIRGDKDALTKEQKKGAISFLSLKDQGGAGCVACHSGKTFSNEKFYNINIPPSGRGSNDSGFDLGRYNVDKSDERFSFRVPILLNIAMTAPYFHNGTALTLEDAIRHKLTESKDKKPSAIIELSDINYDAVKKMIGESFDSGAAKAFLPGDLSQEQITYLVAFLESLTDPCLENAACLKKIKRPIIETPREKVAQRKMLTQAPREKAKEVMAPPLVCKQQKVAGEKADFHFSRHGNDMGIDHKRVIGLIKKGWLMDVINYSSVAAVDVDYDCLDDLVFDAGKEGILFYKQQPDGMFVRQAIPYRRLDDAVNALVMDLDGDYRFDLFVGSYGNSDGSAAFVFDFLRHGDDVAVMRELTGPVINASIGDINGNGHMDVIFALWRSFNSLKQEHIWQNDGAGNLAARNGFIPLHQDDYNMGGGKLVDTDIYIKREHHNLGAPDFTFTPNFVDINNSGKQDLLLTADYFRSQVLRNDGGFYTDISDKEVINDSNGMGTAIGDFNNDGLLDWFVTSINDVLNRLWDGHRLYMNQGDGKFKQMDIVQNEIIWSWGSCAADFNNDGYLDIFYISGFGEPLTTAKYEVIEQQRASEQFLEGVERFSKTSPVLLINDGKAGFTDQSKILGFDEPVVGRGVGCFDYQQDGDIDIVVAPLEGAPVLYKNHLNGQRNWLSLRFIGLPGNTEAFGTKVTLFTAEGKQYRQVRFENNFISRNPAQVNFGLGNLKAISKVVIELPAPNQKVIELDKLEINKLHIMKVEELLKGSL